MTKKKRYCLFSALSILCIALCCYILTSFASEPRVCIYRIEIIVLVYLFLALHCFIDVKKIYDFIYKYRVLVAICLLGIFVANCFTGSSVSMYDAYIQPNSGGDLVQPIWSVARSIRSDEWLVNISRAFAGSYNNYGAVNDIIRGVSTEGISATGGIMLDYSALRTPAYFGYYLFGAEYGNSFEWGYKLFIGGLIVFEFFMILTKDRLNSLFGMVLVWFSPFNFWWSICLQMYAAVAIVVFFYYTLKADDWKKRLLFGTILAIAGADFCTNLYPAWQVPLGWIVVSLLVWLLVENQEWKKFTKLDWLIIAADVLFMGSIILRFLDVNSSYVEAIGQTVYPGHRVSFGGFAIDKLLGYPISSLQGVVEFTNASEISTIFGVFPFGWLLSLYVLWRKKGKDLLIICLLIPSIVYGLYTTVGLPGIVAKVTLLTNSIPERCVDILGFNLAILTVVSLSRINKMKKMTKLSALIVSLICVAPAVYYCFKDTTIYDSIIRRSLSMGIIVVILIVTAWLFYLLLNVRKEQVRKIITILSCVILFCVGVVITPVTVGYEAITGKPVYQEIREIVENSDTRTLWIGTDSIVYQNYLVACGAPTLNSVNYIPNKKIWDALDIEGFDEDSWNRYAHIILNMSNPEQTSAQVMQCDVISIQITPEDILKLNVDYVLGNSGISSAYDDVLECIYDEDGIAIYKVIK